MNGLVLVTGAAGLAGANLVRQLLEQGRNVRAMVHEDRRAVEGLGMEIISADVRDTQSLDQAMAGVEVVYHLAGSISLKMDSLTQMMAINAQGTRNIVEACMRKGVQRLVHFSSIDALHQEPLDMPVDESRALVDEGKSDRESKNIPPYDLSKAQAEREVRRGIEQGLDAIIIRPTAMVGPNDFKPSYQGQALVRLAKGKIPALVNSGFDWVDARDVAAGAIRAEQTAAAGAIFMLGGHWHTLREVAELAAGFNNRAAPRVSVPMWLAEASAPIMEKMTFFGCNEPIFTRVALKALRGNRQVSSAKGMDELGYTTRPLTVTVHDTLTWFQEHGYLTDKYA